MATPPARGERVRSSKAVGPTFAAALLASSGATLWLFGPPGAASVGLWAAWLLAAAAAFRRPLGRIFGPVFFHDLIRNARRPSVVAVRCAYALLLLAVLPISYLDLAVRHGANGWLDAFHTGGVPIGAVGDFNNRFFLHFLGLQLLVVALVTPAYAAGVVTEEKERKTLEYVLATDVGDAEFLLGKLASRLAGMALLLATGLPVLALMQFLGGVDFTFLLAGFAVTLLTMLTLGSLAAALSVRCERTTDAIFRTYSFAFLAYVVSFAGLPVGWISGNPSLLLWYMSSATMFTDGWGIPTGYWKAGPTEPEVLLYRLGDYALFHLTASALLCLWAVWQLRPSALREAAPHAAPKAKEAALPAPSRERPPVSDRPMLWKELHVDAQWFSTWRPWHRRLVAVLGGSVVAFYAIATLASYGLSVASTLKDLESQRVLRGIAPELVARAGPVADISWFGELGEVGNRHFRWVVSAVGTVGLFAVALSAAGKVSYERERHTLDDLLATPMTGREILGAKFVGALAVVRPFALPVTLTTALAVGTWGLHPAAVPLLVVGWLAPAAFFAVVGLWFSQSSGTATATFRTLAVFFAATFALPPLGEWFWQVFGHDEVNVAALLSEGLTPWRSLDAFAIPNEWPHYFGEFDVRSWGGTKEYRPSFEVAFDPKFSHNFTPMIQAAAGTAVYGILARVLWLALLRRFDEKANRPPIRPGRPPAR